MGKLFPYIRMAGRQCYHLRHLLVGMEPEAVVPVEQLAVAEQPVELQLPVPERLPEQR